MNYWQILAAAQEALTQGRFREAETAHDAAVTARQADGRRVFLLETVPDGLQRLWQRWRHREQRPDDPHRGRWERACTLFIDDFRRRAETLLRRAEQQLATGQTSATATVDPSATAGDLSSALYLSVGSRLNERRLPAAPLLVALFDLLPASGRLCDPDLVDRRLELDPAVRLRIGTRAVSALAQLPPALQPSWAGILLDLLADPAAAWQPGTGVQRRWLSACLADRYLEDPAAVLDLLAACDEPEQAEANRRWSRLRRLEILAGRDRRRLAVPGYAEAHRLAALLTPAADDQEERRCAEAMAMVAYRRPQAEPSRGWISATVASDGAVLAVFWWGDQPRDVARWRPQDGAAVIREFLAAADGRVLWATDSLPEAVVAAWPEAGRGRSLTPYLEAVLEPLLPASGWTEALGRRLALARSGGWRTGWRADLGHALLTPPGEAGRLAPEQEEIEPALRSGLLWLAVLHRIATADPALRAGIGELARRGDPAAAFLHAHTVLGAPDQAALDAGFAPWTLPLLWTRPDPLTAAHPATSDPDGLQDLAGQEVAVVVSGQPERVLAAWGPGERRWRVVLDRWSRLQDLQQLARVATGPVTLVPPDGQVHDLRAALALLEDLAAGAAAAAAGEQLLPLYHWIRLVETHNGDLLDLAILRPRPAGACPLHDRYVTCLSDLPREPVLPGDRTDSGGWASQYAQRARRSGLLAGRVDDLPDHGHALDAAWGVYDGSDTSWVFHDSAAVHWGWHLRHQQDPQHLHAMLAGRGPRHLSLLTGRGLYPADLSRWFDQALAPVGRPYHVDLQDSRPPRLRLAGAGPLPGARLTPGAHWAAALAYLAEADETTVVKVPTVGLAGEFWRAAATATFGPVGWRLAEDQRVPAAERLVVIDWSALDSAGQEDPPLADTAADWDAADERRQSASQHLRGVMALEGAALLAEPVPQIVVLDGRWWRRLNAMEALPTAELAGGEAIEILDLPALDSTPEARRLAAATSRWLADHGQVAGQLTGWSGPPLPGAEAIAAGGVHIHQAPAATLWRDLVAALLQAWESGRPAPRLLVVSETPPAGAAAIAAICAGEGATRLQPGLAGPYGALVWTTGRDLLAALRSDAPPPACDCALLLDLQDHLPPARSASAGASLLGWLTAGSVARVDLVGGPLAPAWRGFLVPSDAHPAGLQQEPGGWPILRRGESPRSERRCPQCGATAPGALDGLVCSQCSYHLAGAGPRPMAGDLNDQRTRQLLQQADLGRDEPLEIWGEPAALAGLSAAALQAGAERPPVATAGSGAELHLPDGRRWALRSVQTPSPTAAGPAILLRPPLDPTILTPWARPGVDASLTMLYDRFDVAPPRHGPQLAAMERLLQLLRDPAWLEPGAGEAGSPRPGGLKATVPLWRLAWLAGLSPGAARRGLDLLMWAGTVAGELPPPADREPATATQHLLAHVPVRAMEQRLASLAAELGALLPTWLHSGLPGVWQAVPAPLAGSAPGAALAEPLDTDDPAPLAPLDTLLGLLAAAPPTSAAQFVYQAPAGAWFSRRRLVGWLGDRDQLATVLLGQLDAFAAQLRQLATGSSLSDRNVLWEVPAVPDLLLAQHHLLGQELGFWTRIGPPTRHAVSHDDLRRLQGASAVTATGAGTALLCDLARAEDHWQRRLDRTPPGGTLVTIAAQPPQRPGDHPQRRWWQPGGKADHQPLQAEITTWLGKPAPARLVIGGPCGSGRLDTVLAGLRQAGVDHLVTFWCPDQASAVDLHLTARRLDPSWRPDLKVSQEGSADPHPSGRAPGQQLVTVIHELQRWPREIAYRLQDHARQGHLLLIVDAAEVQPGEAWEGLFLTTPRRGEVRSLRTQRRQARQIWRVTRPFLGEEAGEVRARRRQRGLVDARPAGSLDECAAAMDAAVAAGRLGRTVRLVAPLDEDVQLLGRALADRSWAAVRQQDLAALLLPGVVEAVAAMADAHCQLHGAWPQASDPVTQSARRWLLTELLPLELAADWGAWLRSLPPSAVGATTDFWARLRRSPWGQSVAMEAASQRRFAALVAEAPTPGDLLPPPLWQAWRRRFAAVAGRTDLEAGPPVACLATAREPGGETAESLVYVCFGSEPPAVHRQVLTRVSDRLLVLYQEHSPLPDQWDA